MDESTELDLATLATTDARGFLQAFLEKSECGVSINSVYEIEDLDDETTVDGFHLTLVDSEGGGEGEGEYVERTWKFTHPDEPDFEMYVELQGRYDSYEGTEWDDEIYMVKPVEVLVTQYHAL
jgi:hypothetical protein